MFTSPLIILYILSLASAVFSSPLPLDVDKWVSDVEGDKQLTEEELKTHKANIGHIDTAMKDANDQIKKMKTVLGSPEDAKHKAAIQAAFGKKADIKVIQDTVDKLGTGKMNIQPAQQPYPDMIAATNWKDVGEKGKAVWKPSSVGFGNDFFKGSGAARAGTMIHEGAHYVNKAGDKVISDKKMVTTQFEILQGVDNVPKNRKYHKDADGNGITGYTKSNELPKTVADVEKDKTFTAIRDKVSNMHHNAESYAVFGSLCANMRRRDLHLMARAWGSGDNQEFHRLWQRQSCKLPPNHSKQKATEKAAAAKKSGKSSPLTKSAGRLSKANTLTGKAGGRKTGVAKTGTGKAGIAGRPAKGSLASKQPQRSAGKGAKSTTAAKSGTRLAKGSKQPSAKGSKLAKSGSRSAPAKGSLASKTKGSKLAKSGARTAPAKGSSASKQRQTNAKGSNLAKSGSRPLPPKKTRVSKQPQTNAAKGSKLAKSGGQTPNLPKQSKVMKPAAGPAKVSTQIKPQPKTGSAKKGKR